MRLRLAVAVLDGHGQLDRAVGVHLAGTLLGGRQAQVGRRAGEDLLDQRGGGAHAVVGLLVRLDHQRRAARDERGRLAGTAEVLDRRRSALEVGAAGEAHRVGGADGPAVFAGCHQVGYPAAVGWLDSGSGKPLGRVALPGLTELRRTV